VKSVLFVDRVGVCELAIFYRNFVAELTVSGADG